MGEECRVGAAKPVEPISSPLGLVAQSLVLPTCPPNDIGINPLQGRTQLRFVEVAVVENPAADARTMDRGQILQGFVTAVVKRPASELPADAHQRFRAGGGQKARKGTPSPPGLSSLGN